MENIVTRNERIIPAQNGYTLLAGDTALHSRYNPANEAEKYIDSLSLKPVKYFILLEPGLSYLFLAIKKKFPESQIITLHCSSFFNNIPMEQGPGWNPASGETLEEFLERYLEEVDAGDIKLIDWKPSVNVYGKTCLDLTYKTVECIRRISAGKKTVKNFGKRWFKNALRNLVLLQNPAEIQPGSMPVLVCAAGPSLENSLDPIAEWNEAPFPPYIIAVSSAAPALLYRGIVPDCIITTDGGAWARWHLIEYLRQYNKTARKNPVIVSAFTAALPSQTKQHPVIVFRDGSLWQDLLLQDAHLLQYSPAFPQRGTVSVSALDFSYYLSSGNVYICGLDLENRDLKTHVKPYAFDQFLKQKEDRRLPSYSLFFEREYTIRSSGSQNIYAVWLKSHLSLFGGRLFCFGKSVHGIPSGKPSLNETNKYARFTVQIIKNNINNNNAKRHFSGLLQNALDNPLLNEQLCKELGELLLDSNPPDKINRIAEIKKALLELSDE